MTTRPALSPLDRAERRLGYVLILPAVLLLAAVVVYPIAQLIWTSFRFSQLTQPWMGTPFIGLENYHKALTDPRFWEATLNTGIFIVVTVPGAVVVGLGLALLANQPFKVKWPVRLGLLLPWALPLVFAGLIFRWFFEFNQGIVNNVMIWAGFKPLNWLTEPSWSSPSSGNPRALSRWCFWRGCKPFPDRFMKPQKSMARANGGSSSRSPCRS